QAEDGIRDGHVTGVQTCALPICAALLARRGRVRLREAAENAAAELLRDSRTAVVYADVDVRVALFERDLHLAPLGRELRGIGERSEERRVGKECRSRAAPD